MAVLVLFFYIDNKNGKWYISNVSSEGIAEGDFCIFYAKIHFCKQSKGVLLLWAVFFYFKGGT